MRQGRVNGNYQRKGNFLRKLVQRLCPGTGRHIDNQSALRKLLGLPKFSHLTNNHCHMVLALLNGRGLLPPGVDTWYYEYVGMEATAADAPRVHAPVDPRHLHDGTC